MQWTELADLTVEEIDLLPIAILADIQDSIASERKEKIAPLNLADNILKSSLERRYRSINKTGITRIECGEYEIKVDLPKKIDWDQDKLAEIAGKIDREFSEPMSEYVEVKYSVQEKKYSAWPESLKSLFRSARTESTGKAKIEIIKKGA